jgi:hypothetical protein
MSEYKQMWSQLLAAPRDFLHGLLGGLLGPALALAGAIGLIYGLTRQLPAIKEVVSADGTRNKAIVLAPQAEARASWARYSGDLRGAMLERRATE